MNYYVRLHEEITQLTTYHCWDSIAIWRRHAVQVDLFIKAVKGSHLLCVTYWATSSAHLSPW